MRSVSSGLYGNDVDNPRYLIFITISTRKIKFPFSFYGKQREAVFMHAQLIKSAYFKKIKLPRLCFLSKDEFIA